MQVLLELRDPTADGRQGNTQLAARGRETSHVDRGEQDGHRLQSIHGLPSANERLVTKFTSYCDRLGGSIFESSLNVCQLGCRSRVGHQHQPKEIRMSDSSQIAGKFGRSEEHTSELQ